MAKVRAYTRKHLNAKRRRLQEEERAERKTRAVLATRLSRTDAKVDEALRGVKDA